MYAFVRKSPHDSGPAPKLPLLVLQHLGLSYEWSYRCRLVQGRLYAMIPENPRSPGSYMPTQAAQNIMLAITVMPRLVKPLPYKTKIANAFFILRGVVLVLHQQDAFDKPGDFLSRMAQCVRKGHQRKLPFSKRLQHEIRASTRRCSGLTEEPTPL